MEAFYAWRDAAAKGSVEATALIAKLYFDGKGVARSIPDAVIWYEKAARVGDVASQFQLGKIMLHGSDPWIPATSRDDSLRWSKSSAMTTVFPAGVTLDKAPEAGFAWIEKAAAAGLRDAQAMLGDLLRAGRGCDVDLDAARLWYTKAAEQASANAAFGLGDIYYQGLGVEKDVAVASEWYKKAASEGHVRGHTALGYLHMNGEGVERDLVAAGKYFQEAARHADVNALFSLAEMHIEGAGVSKSINKAETCLRKAGRRGHLPSMIKLGELYSRGFGAEPNLTEAAEWYSLAAEKGNVNSQFVLGRFYANGTGVPPSQRLAAKWFEKAAEGGHAAAAHQIGLILLNGRGVEPDLQRAIHWLRRAAEAGIGQAQLELGRLYFTGNGVPVDGDEAAKWLEKAAAAGDSKSVLAVVDVLVLGGKEARARDLLERLAEGSNGPAKLRLAQLLTKDAAAAADITRALRLYGEAGELGHPEGFLAKGICLMSEGTEVFDSRAAEVALQRAASEGAGQVKASAFFQLGVLFCRREDGKAEVDKGLAYYEQAAKLGHAIAQYNVAVMMQKGVGCSADPSGALVWLKKAADSKLPQAQVALADAEVARRGTKDIPGDVLSLYQLAANAGNEIARKRLRDLQGGSQRAPSEGKPQ
ncbi:sel1 repeat family protein [Rhodopseudomonas sp. HC1]|uniref:tetratricopeptide repeat protein n=1 Tax=Rhodopseudomonas infernalis TaxID=2897386 RepID=UPI001EE85030|nr:tetratricopeptide repeat protein [Rhodopseudomonas infernalis]MCG6205217.1 sel1 repeat family protein [Rhodopseudomonas infernalis]